MAFDIGTIVLGLLPILVAGGVFYYLIERNVKNSAVFAFVLVGVNKVVLSVLSLFRFESFFTRGLNTTSLFVIALLISAVGVFFTLNLLNKKRNIATVAWTVGIIAIATYLVNLFLINILTSAFSRLGLMALI